MLRIHQYKVHIIYKHDPDLHIMDWLSHSNPTENREYVTGGMNVNAISTSVNMPVCMSIEDLQAATHEDAHLQELKACIIQGWSHMKEDVDCSMRQYCPIINELAMIDGYLMKGKE